MGVFALVVILSFPAVVVEAAKPPAISTRFGSWIQSCTTPDTGIRFVVTVEGTNIDPLTNGKSDCPYSYNNNYQSNDDWKAINGKLFKNLETNRFLFPIDSVNTQTPTRIRVEDKASANKFNCGRALWQDKYQDFKFGTTSPNGITSVPSSFPWWPANNKDPVQMTIVPFLGTSDCSRPLTPNDSFSTEESIAVWLSTDPGVVVAPPNTKYCDVARSAEIDNCLNLPYWIVDTPPVGGTPTIKLVGSLYDTLTATTDTKDVSILRPGES